MKKIKAKIILSAILILFTLAIHSHKTFAQVRITEILPNPKGQDKNNEWIELYNDNPNNLNLENWKISNGKKTFIIKSPIIIQANNYFVLEKENLKIAIKNTDGQIQLINPDGKIIDQAIYDKAKDGESFSELLIEYKNESIRSWQWSTPSKNKANQTLHTLTGEIITAPANNKFTIKIKNKNLTITFKKIKNPLLAKVLFQPNRKIKILIDENLELINFKIENLLTTKVHY